MSQLQRVRRLVAEPTSKTSAQVARFGVVGLVAFAFDFSVMVACKEFGQIDYMLAAAIGFLVGVSVNYILSISWVFDVRRVESQRVEFAIFACLGVIGLGLTELICWFGTDVLGNDYRVSKVASVIVVAFWNYLAKKSVLFSHRDTVDGRAC